MDKILKIRNYIAIVASIFGFLSLIVSFVVVVVDGEERKFSTKEMRYKTELYVNTGHSINESEKTEISLHVEDKGEFRHLTVPEREKLAVMQQNVLDIKKEQATIKKLLYSINAKIP